MDIDEVLSSFSLDREEAKTVLIIAVGVWLASVLLLETGPLVASGVVGAFVAFFGYFLLDMDEI